MTHRATWRKILGCGLALLASATASAADDADAELGTRYRLSAGVAHSDNVARTRLSPVEETAIDAGLVAGIRYDHNRFNLELDADLLFRKHDYSGFGNELIGGLAAEAEFELVHEHLSWIFEENLGHALVSSLVAGTPGNTQNLNLFSTGPNAYLPLGSRAGVRLQGRLTDVSYQESDGGNRRVAGLFGVTRAVGDDSSISLNGSLEKVYYKNLPSSRDYDIQSVFADWEAVGSRTTLRISAGYSTLNQDAESSKGAIYGVELVRRLTSRSNVTLGLGHSFGDSADSLRREQQIGGVSGGSVPTNISSDPLESDYASLGWEFVAARSALALAIDWRRESHTLETLLDRELKSGSIRISRRLGPRFTLAFTADYASEDFATADIGFDEWSSGIGIEWALTPSFGFGLDWMHLEGIGDTIAGPGTRDFVENRYTLRFSWSSGRR